MSTIQTVRLAVPGVKLDEFSLILFEEAFTFTVNNAPVDNVYTVEVTGSELQVAEATRLLSVIGTETHVFYATNRQLASVLNIARNSGCKINRVQSAFRIFGKTRFHLIEVTGFKEDIQNFKVLKSRNSRLSSGVRRNTKS